MVQVAMVSQFRRSRGGRLLFPGGSTPPKTVTGSSQPRLASPVELGAGALPSILGVAAWPHPEHSHRYAGKLPAVASEKPVGVAVPASGVQRSPEHDQVESGDRFPHRLGLARCDLSLAATYAVSRLTS